MSVVPGKPPPVLAAGALAWREKGEKIQVLLVHRPRYDDWSIPKGKLDKGETFPAAAVREGAAELGFVEGGIDDPALASMSVAEDRLLIVVAHDHPLAAVERATPEDLRAAEWVLREAGSGTRST